MPEARPATGEVSITPRYGYKFLSWRKSFVMRDIHLFLASLELTQAVSAWSEYSSFKPPNPPHFSQLAKPLTLKISLEIAN